MLTLRFSHSSWAIGSRRALPRPWVEYTGHSIICTLVNCNSCFLFLWWIRIFFSVCETRYDRFVQVLALHMGSIMLDGFNYFHLEPAEWAVIFLTPQGCHLSHLRLGLTKLGWFWDQAQWSTPPMQVDLGTVVFSATNAVTLPMQRDDGDPVQW